MSNSYTDEDLERCTLSGRREILFQLRNLIRQSERVSVSFDEGRQSFLTVLIDFSEDDGYLYFDIGGSEETNVAFLKAERCLFGGMVEGIRIQFSAKQARKTTFKGEQVFAVALPNSLLRLQRREAFRLQLPTSKPYICRIRRGSPEEIALPLYDISVGGVGIQASEQLSFEPLEKLENCWIDLRDSGVLPVTLEVRYLLAKESRTRKAFFHLGCRFLKLSPLNETLIQRFMARIEAERRTLSAG
ncbi:flagellar brake protein [Propionivibrio sp.]|uniref:flagellar brake protein n=1 Tax=Propionivibrio sp. TaxID=2212460 RepID=UPI003BF3F0BC